MLLKTLGFHKSDLTQYCNMGAGHDLRACKISAICQEWKCIKLARKHGEYVEWVALVVASNAVQTSQSVIKTPLKHAAILLSWIEGRFYDAHFHVLHPGGDEW